MKKVIERNLIKEDDDKFLLKIYDIYHFMRRDFGYKEYAGAIISYLTLKRFNFQFNKINWHHLKKMIEAGLNTNKLYEALIMGERMTENFFMSGVNVNDVISYTYRLFRNIDKKWQKDIKRIRRRQWFRNYKIHRNETLKCLLDNMVKIFNKDQGMEIISFEYESDYNVSLESLQYFIDIHKFLEIENINFDKPLEHLYLFDCNIEGVGFFFNSGIGCVEEILEKTFGDEENYFV